MQQERQNQWQQLLDFTSDMLRRAQAGEWDDLSAMAGERQLGFERFFAEPVTTDYAATVAEGIHTISRIDAEIAALAATAHGVITREQEMLNKRQLATRAYTDPRIQRR